MACVSDESLKHLVWRLKRLRNKTLANRILWLAAEQRLEWLPDGRVAFWTRAKEVLVHLQEGRSTPLQVRLTKALWVDPTACAPRRGPAVWCAVNPKAILGSRAIRAGRLQVRVQEVSLLIELEKEPVVVRRKNDKRALGKSLSEKSLPLSGSKTLSKSLVALLGR